MSTSFLVCQRCNRLIYPANCTLTVDMREFCMCSRPLAGTVHIIFTSSTAGHIYNDTHPPRTAVPAAIYDAFKDGDLDL